MQAPTLAAHGTDPGTVVAPTGTAPFVLSRPHGTVVGDGVADRWSCVGDAAAALRAGTVRAVVGALPFDPDHPAALTAPHALTHAAAPITDTGIALPRIGIDAALPSEREHVDRITTALIRLRSDDDLVKVVLARTLVLRADRPVTAGQLLHRLAGNDPHGNAFAVDLSPAGGSSHGRYLVGASPEVLVRRHGDRVTAHPLAGSAPRHTDPEIDRRTGAELAASTKNLTEHAHVVADLRANLEPLCIELDIPDRPTLTSTRQLWHLGTPVSGRLRDPSVTALDLAVAVHPTPAVCGTPTAAARELIRELEGDRGFYAGAIGWCDAAGDGEWMVAIRCAVLDADGRTITAHAGGGIVAESDPDDELAETTTKFGTVLDALAVHR